jgi:hypothetical protein
MIWSKKPAHANKAFNNIVENENKFRFVIKEITGNEFQQNWRKDKNIWVIIETSANFG